MWAGILSGGRSELYISNRTMRNPEYVTSGISNIVVSFHAAAGEKFSFFTRPSRAAVVIEALRRLW